MLAVLLATVLSESGLAGSAGAESAPAVVTDGVAAVVVGIAAEVPPAPALSQGFGGDKPDMLLLGVALKPFGGAVRNSRC